MEPTSMLSTILTAVGQIVTSAVTWCSSFLGMITQTGNEILLIWIILPLVGLGIGILSRLFKIN